MVLLSLISSLIALPINRKVRDQLSCMAYKFYNVGFLSRVCL